MEGILSFGWLQNFPPRTEASQKTEVFHVISLLLP